MPVPSSGVSPREFEEVIRRATELAQAEPEGREGHLPEEEVFRIAQEVGLAERHVRTALAQVRGEAPPPRRLDRVFGAARAQASRVVPHSRGELVRMLDNFFVSGELLESVRRRDDYLLYRPSSDWLSSILRSTRGGRKYHWATARELEVRLEEVEGGRTWIELQMDSGSRSEYLWTAGIVGGSLGVGAGVGAAALLFTGGLLAPVAVAGGMVAGGAVLAGAGGISAHANRKKLEEVQAELEGVLDELEAGRILEPAPASWTGWVKKQMKLFGSEWRNR